MVAAARARRASPNGRQTSLSMLGLESARGPKGTRWAVAALHSMLAKQSPGQDCSWWAA